MSLSTAQKIALFQILEVPYTRTVGHLQDADNLLSLQYQSVNSDNSAYTQIMDHLAALDSEVESVLESYLDEWICLGTDSYRLDGGVGGISGISYSDNNERDIIRRNVLVIVPYYRYHEEMKNQHRAGRNIMLIR